MKLDKKLTISIDTVKIDKKNRPAGAVGEIERVGTLIQYLPHYFNKVVVKNLVVGNRIFHLTYDKEVFYFDADTFELISRISFDPKTKTLSSNIKKLYIKRPKVLLSGVLTYDLRSKIWKGKGEYNAFDIEGNFKITHKNNYFTFALNSKPCTSIKPLIDYINPPEQIKVWIYPKIPARKYELHYLRGGFILEKDGSVSFDPRKLRAFATAYDAKIHFHPDVPPVSTRKIDIRLKNDTLSFKLYNPLYEGKRLDGSYVKIRNLTTKRAKLDAHIVVKDKIDESIKKILEAYGINLPFVQTDGTTDAVVDFTVALKEGKVTKYKGLYRSEYAKLLFDNTIPLPVRDLNVVSIGSKMEILPCNIKLNPYLDANVSGIIDLNKRNGTFNSTINRLVYRYRDTPLIDMSGANLDILLDFRNGIRFTIPELNVDIVYKQGGGIEAEAKEIHLLKPYFSSQLKQIKSGDMYFKYNKPGFFLKAKIVYPNNIFTIDKKTIDTFHIRAYTQNDTIHVAVNGTVSITATKKKTAINLKNIDIHLDELLQKLNFNERLREKRLQKMPYQSGFIEISGYNSDIWYKKFQLSSLFYNVKIRQNPFYLKFETKHKKGKIRGIVEKDKINIVGKNLSDATMRRLTTLNQLKGGSFDFDAKGKIDDFGGTIFIRDSLWAKTALYNNLLATLNTIPAILTLKNPGFSKKGFKIKRGALEYRFKDKKLFFRKILIEGYSAQITGKGSINFEKELIAIRLQIHFLESLTNVLNKIPVAGYLIFGKDGTLAVTLNISGPLENPKVTTEATKDIIRAPINILERTLTLPFKIFK